MSYIQVEFKLLVINNYVQVPGNEPPSVESSLSLSRSYYGKNPTIPLAKALELIPGSSVRIDSTLDGNFGNHQWFILPTGPAPVGNKCPEDCVDDWYKLLQDNAEAMNPNTEGDLNNQCSGYDFGYCDMDDFSNSLDPAKRV